ncbi:MAG: HAMP domain-containing protein [Silicimonas sp.]|nr:HAMP domain-containing protein [Silicimonas sp.]
MSIATRIFLGMASMIALIILVGGFASYQANNLANVFVDYRETSQQGLLVSEMTESLTNARIASLNYRNTKDEAFIEELSRQVAKIALLADALDASEQSDFDAVPDLLSKYESNMRRVHDLQRLRNDLVQVAAESSQIARQNLADIRDTAVVDVAQIGSSVGIAENNLLLSQLYIERFLGSNSQSDFARSTKEIETARSGLDRLMTMVRNQRQRQLVSETVARLDKFNTSTAQLSEITQARNAAYALMDEIGAKALSIMEQETKAALDMQNTLGASGLDTAKNVISVVLAVVLAGAVVGIVCAHLIGRNITVRLKKVTREMIELANGNLGIVIADDDSTHEIAKMSEAMTVFQENAIKARELEAEVKEAERKNLERTEAEHKRKAEIAEETREVERQQKEETQRHIETLEAFQEDMQRVIGQAATGNFSLRMSSNVSEPSLLTLATLINELMQAMEDNVADLVSSIGELAKGNLGVRMEGERQGVFLNIKEDFNAALITLSETIAAITLSGQTVSQTSSGLKKSSGEMARRAEENAATAEQTSAAVEEITASIRQVVENAKAADQATQRVRKSADETRRVSTETEATINEMTEASAQINRVVKVIEDIAFQINLLALNAGVEAARAGEAGLGFSVVASEVRALALRSQEAVQEITQVIQQSNLSVEAGVEQVGLSREALEGIITEVEVASGQISEIASAVEEQAKGIEEINSAIRTIDITAQKNAATLEEMTASNISLSEEASRLEDSLKEFQGVKTCTNSVRVTKANQAPKFVHTQPKMASVAGHTKVLLNEEDGWDEF